MRNRALRALRWAQALVSVALVGGAVGCGSSNASDPVAAAGPSAPGGSSGSTDSGPPDGSNEPDASRGSGGSSDAGEALDAGAVSDAGGASCAPIETWGAAVMKGSSGGVLAQSNAGFHDQTLRQTVHASVGGASVTVRLSNEFGTTPLSVGAAHVALPQSGSTIDAATDHALTFGGASAVQIPAGGTARSDPAPLAVAAGGDVTLSLYLSGSTGPATFHPVASAPAFVNAKGDDTAHASFSAASSPTSWFLVTGVQVCADPKTRLVVAFGDSITDGYQSTTSSNTRWPDGLARRLAKEPTGPWAVVNAGISGNGLLSEIVGPSGLSRLSRDVFARGSVAYMIVLEGINDIGIGKATAAQLEDGYQALEASARGRGIHVIGATLLPYKGSLYYSSAGEAVRQAVNAWIRTSGTFDAVIDFEKVVRDPKDSAALLAAYDSGDHLHPNSKGYGAMAEAIDMALFK